MKSIFFSYKVDTVVLKPYTTNLNISESFNKSEINNEILKLLKEKGLSSNMEAFTYVLKDNIVFVEGIANEIHIPSGTSLIFSE